MNSIAGLLLTLFTIGAPQPQPVVEPKYSLDCVLEAVALRKRIELREEIPRPTIYLESKIPLKQFQDAVEPQWGIRPEALTNVYVRARNEIYLIDEAGYYERTRRFIDDSLAHELTHYLQDRYQNADLQQDESLEPEAIDVQNWFRETFLETGFSPCPKLAE